MSHARGSQQFQLRLGRDHDAAAEARRELDRFRPDLDDTDAEIVALLMTELVANSVKHAGAAAGDQISVAMKLTATLVRVEVRDGGPGFVPHRRNPDDRSPGHWGLELVERLSDRWQVVPGEGRGETAVWFELDRGVARLREELDGYGMSG